jgi:DNA phosphorothioation-dependent restriction protein DptG
MVLKAKREKTKGIVIVDPYFMCDVALANEGERAMVKEYLGNILVENPTIDSILLPCFPE